jgi:hypothetical protein
MSRSPPLRFLLVLLAGWTAIRTALLAPAWWTPPAEAGAAPPASDPKPQARSSASAVIPATRSRPLDAAGSPVRAIRMALSRHPTPARAAAPLSQPPFEAIGWTLSPASAERRRVPAARPSPGADAGLAVPSRWSFAAWSFLRRGDGPALAPGGILGGSQAGARAGFRINRDPSRPLALALRVAAPLRRPGGAEAAAGLDWQPSRRLPIHLLAERRQRLGPDGRSAFGLTLHGGVSGARLGDFRIDAYAQAGIVGVRSLDLFGDGALRVSLPIGRRARIGAGAWAAAQPGVARLDLGPQASVRLPLPGRNVTLAADWRLRAAGNARPGSGPALTLAADF